MNHIQIKRNVILSYLERYQNASTRGIARMLRRDEPMLFVSVESARTSVRTYRGSNGKFKRKVTKINQYFTDAAKTKLAGEL